MRASAVRGQWVLVCFLLAAVASGCEEKVRSHASAAPPAARIVVTHDDGSLPPTCGVSRTASRVLAFEAAFNRGDPAALNALIADADHFQWYSVADGGSHSQRGFNATGRTSALELSPPDERPAVLRYLARRQRQGERMRLMEIKVTRIPPRNWFPSIEQDVAGIEFTIRRDGPDFAKLGGNNRLGGGKGGFACSDGRLLAWSTGLRAADPPRPGEQHLCRDGRRSRLRHDPHRRVIACTG